jgi:hypothetical protein
MTSLIRISDIPPEELHLLPIIGLRQQIRADRSWPSSPDSRTGQGERDGDSFVTDWQLQDEPRPDSRLPADREDTHEDEDRDDEDIHHEDFDNPEHEDAGEEDDWGITGGRFTSLGRSRWAPAGRR